MSSEYKRLCDLCKKDITMKTMDNSTWYRLSHHSRGVKAGHVTWYDQLDDDKDYCDVNCLRESL